MTIAFCGGVIASAGGSSKVKKNDAAKSNDRCNTDNKKAHRKIILWEEFDLLSAESISGMQTDSELAGVLMGIV
jgi:hypothetical protein